MKIRIFVSVSVLVAIIGILLPSASADQFDKETRFTCSEPVQVAGVVLQPGTYWFKLDNLATHNVVVIRNEDRTRLVARVYAIANYRLRPEEDTTFEYWNPSAGETLALRAWFYPGDTIGFEFALNP